MHLAEGVDQRASGELDLVARAGCLDRRTVAVHAVGLDENGRRRLMGEGCGAIWCPSSNLAMLGSTLDPRRWMDPAGGGRFRLGLGTDSRLTGVDDILEELRVAATTSGLGAAEAARDVDPDAERAHAHGVLNGTLHRAAEHDAALELLPAWKLLKVAEKASRLTDYAEKAGSALGYVDKAQAAVGRLGRLNPWAKKKDAEAPRRSSLGADPDDISGSWIFGALFGYNISEVLAVEASFEWIDSYR